MEEVYLLDTNAFFNFLKYSVIIKEDQEENIKSSIIKIKNNKCYISTLSGIEIISVIGKYARTAKIDNSSKLLKPMKPRVVKQWLKLVDDTLTGKSSIITLKQLPFSQNTINEAQRIILHALIHNFGSLDSIIAATASEFRKTQELEKVVLVTSDKGLIACLRKCDIPFWDPFSN